MGSKHLKLVDQCSFDGHAQTFFVAAMGTVLIEISIAAITMIQLILDNNEEAQLRVAAS